MLIEQILVLIDNIQKELLLFASLCFLIGSIDDLIFDILWIVHAVKRKFFVYRKHEPITAEGLPDIADPSSLAVFVPAWQEAPVIGAMIRRCLDQWQHDDYRIYVGCYPNDQATIAAVQDASGSSGKIRIIICDKPGPTSKADCLNKLWAALCRDEIEESRNFRAVILHDAEDLVHPKALELFNHLVGRACLVQIPVIPRRASRSRWIAGHYGDEFAELHGKQMVLREALGVSIPAAGVGCAFSRDALNKLSIKTRGKPFDATSMTEDYELGLQLTGGESRGIFARLKDQHGQLVATQEFFPENLDNAIRQKSRWMAGIALSGWDRLGWQNSWRENWMRLRDRKASLAAIVLAMAYLAIILTGILAVFEVAGLYEMQPVSPLLQAFLWINLGFLIWRLILKAQFVFSVYGLQEALLSVPRTLVANIVNVVAGRRAMIQYLGNISGTPPKWEKTDHFHPPFDEVEKLKSTRSKTVE